MKSDKSIWSWRGHNIKLMARAIPPYILGTGYASSPKIAKFDITYACHLRCKMCFYWNEEASVKTVEVIQKSGEELSSSDIQQYLIPQLNEVRLEYLNITGGEPLKKKNIYDILPIFGRQQFRVSLNSNLPNMDMVKAEHIVKSNVHSVQASLHGPQEVHDLISGKKGAYEDVINGLKDIAECKNRLSSRYPQIVICCVISSYNQNYLIEVLDLAEELKVDTIFFHLMEWQDANLLAECHQDSRAKMTLTNLLKVDIDILMEQIKQINKIAEQKLHLKMYFHPLHYPFTKDELKLWYYNPQFSRVKKCFYLWMETRIDPYGYVLPCYYIDQPMGNIKEQRLMSIWNDKQYRSLRKRVAKGLLPMCYKCCKLSRSWQNFLFHL